MTDFVCPGCGNETDNFYCERCGGRTEAPDYDGVGSLEDEETRTDKR